MSLPADVTRGVTSGHLSHHSALHTAAGFSITPTQGASSHDLAHEYLKTWYDAKAEGALPDMVDEFTHEAIHEMLHPFTNPITNFTLGETKPLFYNSGHRPTTPLTVNTGTGGVFVPVSGATYTKVNFQCIVRCNGITNVTFRDCLFSGTASGGTGDSALVECQADSTSGIVIEFCTFKPQTPSQYWNGIRGRGYTVRRSEFMNVVDAFGANRSGVLNVVVEGNYIHDLSYFSPCDYQNDNRTHNDGGQIQGGSTVTIRGNTILANASATVGNGSNPAAPAPDTYYPSVTGQALAFTPQTALGSITNMTIDKNWIDFGAKGMTFAKGTPAGSNLGTITNNRFGRNIALIGGLRRAIVIDPAHSYTASGNVYEDDGTPVTIYVTTSY